MPIRFVCLANSYKEGGRCLSGIVIDNNNQPQKEYGRFKWIRPISRTDHGEIRTHLASSIKVLDVLEIEVTEYLKDGYQSENALFNEQSIKVVGKFPEDRLQTICSNRMMIFENRGKAVPEGKISNLNYSLMFVKVTTFEVIEKIYDDSPDRSKTRLVFIYNKNQYDLPITDPVFLHSYQSDPSFIEDIESVYLTLSLGIKWQGWYYKLVASVIVAQTKSASQPVYPF